MNGHRVKLRKPPRRCVRDQDRGGAPGRLARFGVEHLEAALAATGRGLVVLHPDEVKDDEVKDDLVRDMIEVLTGMCARPYGRWSARKRADAAMRAAERAG